MKTDKRAGVVLAVWPWCSHTSFKLKVAFSLNHYFKGCFGVENHMSHVHDHTPPYFLKHPNTSCFTKDTFFYLLHYISLQIQLTNQSIVTKLYLHHSHNEWYKYFDTISKWKLRLYVLSPISLLDVTEQSFEWMNQFSTGLMKWFNRGSLFYLHIGRSRTQTQHLEDGVVN